MTAGTRCSGPAPRHTSPRRPTRSTQRGARVAWRATDIKDAAQCLAALAEERFGGIDAVVHVAAMDGCFGGLADADFETWKTVLDVNLLGTLRMTRACLPGLRGRGGGAVVFIGTQSAVAAPSQVRQAAYASSKGALTSAMYSLARELGPERIRVDTVLPGRMWGPPVQAFAAFTAHTEGVPEDEVLHRLADRRRCPNWPRTATWRRPRSSWPPTGRARSPGSRCW